MTFGGVTATKNVSLDVIEGEVHAIIGPNGAGKTTLLNRLIRSPQMAKALVIINEFGSIGLDHDLVARSNEDDTIIEMASGCLCCTIKGDLRKTLAEAPWRFARQGKRWFDRVVIETTGLADPAPIIHTVMADEKLNPESGADMKEAFNIGTDFPEDHPDVLAGKPFRGVNFWPS